VKGRKRHILVDTQGLVFVLHLYLAIIARNGATSAATRPHIRHHQRRPLRS